VWFLRTALPIVAAVQRRVQELKMEMAGAPTPAAAHGLYLLIDNGRFTLIRRFVNRRHAASVTIEEEEL